MVLVHGLGGSRHNFEPVIAALERRHDVLAVGLLGHDPSRPFAPGVRASVAALVDGVEHDMDAAGFETAHLVGNSLGGWVVLELAKRGRARSVVALSPGGGQLPGSLSADLTAMRLTLEHRLVAALPPSLAASLVRRPRLRRLLFAGTFTHPERVTASQGLQMLRAFGGATAFVDLLRAIKRDGPLSDLDRIAAPVLIAWGTVDRLLPAGYFAPILRDGIPGAEFLALPGLGHVPMVDDPEQVASVILEFAARYGGRPRADAAVASPAP
jgi:pimeloyl-ACP methyl ester carboxylesterase